MSMFGAPIASNGEVLRAGACTRRRKVRNTKMRNDLCLPPTGGVASGAASGKASGAAGGEVCAEELAAHGGSSPLQRIVDGLLRDLEEVRNLMLAQRFTVVEPHDLLLVGREELGIVEKRSSHAHTHVEPR